MDIIEWQSDPIAAAERFLGSAIATLVAPELQMPVGDAVDRAMEEEWRQLRASLYAQDAELAERSMDLLDHCWATGAISETEYRKIHDRWTGNEGQDDDGAPLHQWA